MFRDDPTLVIPEGSPLLRRLEEAGAVKANAIEEIERRAAAGDAEASTLLDRGLSYEEIADRLGLPMPQIDRAWLLAVAEEMPA